VRTSQNSVKAKFGKAPALYCAENPAKFWSGYSAERASLVAVPRSVASDGSPLENPAETEAQAPRHAPLGKIGKCQNVMGANTVRPSYSSTLAPAHLRTCPSVVKCTSLW
jgi:hypothetical protein